jgi:hypothetical protein
MSFEQYNLETVGYSRLIVHPKNRVTYFERELCTRKSPILSDPAEF